MNKKAVTQKKSYLKQRKSGIFLLPNLLTTTGLFFAFYAIVSAMNGDFEIAATAVFISLLADVFDGRVARLTNTTSDFGAHYDSLADMVSFGLAPALLVYESDLNQFGKIGWLTAFLYTASTALRLARFNTLINSQDKSYFQGLACPAAAGVMAGAVWLSNQGRLMLSDLAMLVMTIILAMLQVSNVRYYSFKEVDLSHRVKFVTVCLIALLLVGVAMNPPLVLFSSFMIYVISGPALTLYQFRLARKQKKKKRHQRKI